MAAALVARGPIRSRSTEILCAGSFSIVVDSVDGDVTGGPADDEVFGGECSLPVGGDIDARSDISNASSRGSRTSLSKEETDAKLALFKASTMAVGDSVEAVLAEIGFGRWQSLVMVFALIFHAIIPVQQIGSTLLGAPVPFRCSYPDYIKAANLINATKSGYLGGLSDGNVDEFNSECLPDIKLMDFENHPHPEVYKINLNRRATGLPSCPEIEYDTSTFQSTVITEWNLVCEKSNLRPLYQMTYSIGAILGSTFCGQLSDWIGRKRTLQIGGILTMATVLGTSMVPWYSVMILMRILTGAGSIIMMFPVYTLLSEITPPNHRTLASLLPGMTYFAFMAVFAGIAYLMPDWRKLILLCNSPFIFLVPLTFLIDESPRWLIQQGRTTEAVDLLRKAAKQNRVTISPSTSSALDRLSDMSRDIAVMKFGGGEKVDNDNQGSMRMLLACFSSPGMRIILIVTPIMWLLKRSLYIGIVLNANNFTSTNPFVYVAFSGAMGVLAMILSIPLSLKLPRRIFVGGTLSIGGILLLLELPIPSDFWWAKWGMVMTSFCLVCGAFQINYIYAAELFPTVIRTRGFTFTNFIGSIGEMSIPLVTDIVVQYQWWASSVTFGCAGIIASLLLPLLPETMNRPMPETLEDVEDRFWNEYKGHGADIIVTKDPGKGKATFQV